MLERIPREQVRLGMYIQAIEGPWLSHPFWKSRFLLSDPADLRALLESEIDAVVIDSHKGVGIATARAEPPAQQPCRIEPARIARRPGRPRRSQSLAPPALQTCATAEELDRASQIIIQSKEAVRQLFDDTRLGKPIEMARILPLVEEISASVTRNPSALISVARLKTKDEYTYLHSVAVCALMINLGRQLKLDESVLREVGIAGLLHDIGKVAMPGHVLNKPGGLTDAEFSIMKGHPRRGWEALRKREDVPEIALDVCLHHHEKIDGTGYPDRLKQDEISYFARMSAVCDVYDAVTSRRPYKEAWGAADSLKRMYGWRGHFDPEILAAFIRSVGIYPVGTLVRLRSDRLAVVADQNPVDLTRPIVRAFWSVRNRTAAAIEDIDLIRADETIVSRDAPEDWGLMPWDSLWQSLLREKPGKPFRPTTLVEAVAVS